MDCRADVWTWLVGSLSGMVLVVMESVGHNMVRRTAEPGWWLPRCSPLYLPAVPEASTDWTPHPLQPGSAGSVSVHCCPLSGWTACCLPACTALSGPGCSLHCCTVLALYSAPAGRPLR